MQWSVGRSTPISRGHIHNTLRREFWARPNLDIFGARPRNKKKNLRFRQLQIATYHRRNISQIFQLMPLSSCTLISTKRRSKMHSQVESAARDPSVYPWGGSLVDRLWINAIPAEKYRGAVHKRQRWAFIQQQLIGKAAYHERLCLDHSCLLAFSPLVTIQASF